MVRVDEVLDFLRPLPVSALWGVGPATLDRLTRLGVTTIADLADLPVEVVTASLGQAAGQHLHGWPGASILGRSSPTRPPSRWATRRPSPTTTTAPRRLSVELVRLADSGGRRLRHHGLAGRTITMKIRFSDFHTITRSATRPGPHRLDPGHHP